VIVVLQSVAKIKKYYCLLVQTNKLIVLLILQAHFISSYLFCSVDIRKIIHINKLIKGQRTGSPKTLSINLGVSERTTHNYLRFMRKELKAPIKWNTYKKTYTYENTGEFKFEWQENK
jgi:hypothetical protein